MVFVITSGKIIIEETKINKVVKEKMKRGVERGLDYTPLFKFLLSKVGSDWDSVLVRLNHDLIKLGLSFGW